MTKERLAELLFVIWQKERVPGGQSIRLEDAPKDVKKSWEAIAKAAIDVVPKSGAPPQVCEKKTPVTIPSGDGWTPTKK
ncbi:MAG TPA: hypothetical protein VHA14_07620 [Bryobacteraceae bacterium]|nr:hypothetical protein [Bryobacteraceae bacterium]